MATSPLNLGTVPSTNPLTAIFPGQAGNIVSAPTPLVTVQRTLWKLVDSLWGGTRGMRLAAELYLPPQANEQKVNYARRLGRATLHNYYKSSIQAAVGKVFAKDVHIEKPSMAIELIVQDVDAQGRNLSQFAKSALEDAINHGVGFILVDHTRVPEEFANLAEQQESGARPYWVNIPATKVLDARSGDFGGSQRLAYFRYEEEVWEASDDGFKNTSYRQVRIFKQDPGQPVIFAVYREQSQAANWVLIDAGVLDGVTAIPIVPIYTNRFGFFLGSPPLQDLADVNIQHWQCSSDYQNSVHTASIPFLLTKGLASQMDENGNLKELTVDVNAGIVATDPNATVEWIEVSGAALAAARANIEGLEETMEKLGTTLCAQTPGNVTATNTAINAAEANSIVKGWALSLQDAINGALYFTAQYLTDTQPGEAQVNTDYAADYAAAETMADVVNMFKEGAIDAETVIHEGKRRNVLDPLENIAPPAQPPADVTTADAQQEALTPNPAVKAEPQGAHQ